MVLAIPPKIGWFGFLLAAAFACGGCKDRAALTQTHADPPVVTPAPVDNPRKTTVPEDIDSIVRVEVTVGAIPTKTYTGVLIHRDELGAVPGMQGDLRCVLALLAGWNGGQLRHRECKITVVHTLPGGLRRATRLTGRLLQFNEQTKIAAVGYSEGTTGGDDPGFHLEKNAAAAGEARAVRTLGGVQSSGPYVLKLQNGQFTASGSKGLIQFPPDVPEMSNDESPALILKRDRLIGFLAVEEGSNDAALVPVADFKLSFKVPTFELLGIGFGKVAGSDIVISIKTKPEGREQQDQQSQMAELRRVELSDPRISAPKEQPVYSPIETKAVTQLTYNRSDGWRSVLPLPQIDGEETSHLVQMGLSDGRQALNPSIYSRPFVVKLIKNGAVVSASVDGLPKLERGYPQGTFTTFEVEAPIHDFHEIAGGREVLFQLEKSPFWKRFSLTRDEWLPLPPTSSEDICITGNLSSLFVLDRKTGEVRRYDLATLQQKAVAQLGIADKFRWILAGGNTAAGPLHVLGTSSKMAISAQDLRPLDPIKLSRPGGKFSSTETNVFEITGDGLFFSQEPRGQWIYRRQYYTGDTHGAHSEFFDRDDLHTTASCGVSMAYGLKERAWLLTQATPNAEVLAMTEPASPPVVPIRTSSTAPSPRWLIPTAPIVFRHFSEDVSTIPYYANRVECFSYFDSKPFAEVETPELSGVNMPTDSRRLFFDPYSLRLGVVAADRQRFVVHQVTPIPGRTQPVLLNWPDALVPRGETLRFKPVLLGGDSFSATVLGGTATEPLKTTRDEITLSVGKSELASTQLLTLKIPGKESELSYGIPIHSPNSQPVFVASRDVETNDIGTFGVGLKSVPVSKESYRVLRTTLHPLGDPVRDVLGPIGGHLILVAQAGRLDFFSIEERKIAKSIEASATGFFSAGAGAVFEFDPVTRTLTRISVPGGQREAKLTMPGNLKLRALGVGTAQTSPVTLLLEQTNRQDSERFGDLVVTMTEWSRTVVVLDNRTLQGATWAQPKPFMPGNPDTKYQFGAFVPDGISRLAIGHSGQFITLPPGFLALSRAASIGANLPDKPNSANFHYGSTSATGSISGMRTANSIGSVFTGGVSDEFNRVNNRRATVTPCGRYRLVDAGIRGEMDRHVEIRTVENDRLLLQLARLSIDDGRPDGSDAKISFRRISLGDNGPLVMIAAGGRGLEIVDCDIPALAKSLYPKEFHVTSQAPPVVVAGGTLEYQIATNNPSNMML